jgi:hypothetical protein
MSRSSQLMLITRGLFELSQAAFAEPGMRETANTPRMTAKSVSLTERGLLMDALIASPE